MRHIKKLSCLILGFAFCFLVVSCNTKTEDKPKPEPPVEELTESDLTGISVDSSKAKTTFYLGDEFSKEGLVVYQDYTKYVDGKILTDQKECTDYYLECKELDMSKVGNYEIKVIYRRGTIIYDASYQIKVLSSILEASGAKYASGLEVSYDAKTDLLLNEEFTFDKTKLAIKLHLNQGGTEAEVKDLNPDDIQIDANSVDSTKVGSYMIKYSYTETLSINGSSYQNSVTSFTIVTVSNPATSINLESGTTELPASVSKLDTSDWKIKITRTVGEPEIVDFSEDLFDLDGVTPYLVGRQYAMIYLKEDRSISSFMAITIKESEDYNILVGDYLTNLEELSDGRIQLNESGKFFINGEGVKFAVRNGKDSYSSLTFGDRITIKGSAQRFEIVMDQPGTIILYVASSGSEAREIIVAGPDGEDIESFMTSSVKQQITEVRLDVAVAGTYSVYNTAGGCYVHGCIIATEKN